MGKKIHLVRDEYDLGELKLFAIHFDREERTLDTRGVSCYYVAAERDAYLKVYRKNNDVDEQLPRVTKYLSRIFVQAFELPFNELPLYLHAPAFSSGSYQRVFRFRLEQGK